MINGGGAARPDLERPRPRPPQRAVRRHAAQGAAARGAGRRRHPRGAAAGGPGLVERAVEALLDPGRRPTRSWPASTGHRGRPHRRAGRRRHGGAARRPRGLHQGGRPPARRPRRPRRRWVPPGAASSRAGRRRPRWPTPTRSCSSSSSPGARTPDPAGGRHRGASMGLRLAASLIAPMGKASSSKKVARAARAGGRTTSGTKRQLRLPARPSRPS